MEEEMKDNPTKSALIVIDMENGFISAESAQCIKNAEKTIPACTDAVHTARSKGIPVFFVKRIYRSNGSDVEMTRYEAWKNGGRGMGPSSRGAISAEAPEGLRPVDGDYTIIKPRWSAFFHTELDLILRRLQIETVLLIGTTTPNCIRTACYDANSLEYGVVILEDCCSSQTEEIQRVNMEDMRRMGAVISNSEEFRNYSADFVPALRRGIYQEMLDSEYVPEHFASDGKHTGWFDRW
ncbi:MAG: cysteine hydrolase [Oscillospiraceae bacterium]|nr:cysteine hydrolase [Oscillospiraceae bacterium]